MKTPSANSGANAAADRSFERLLNEALKHKSAERYGEAKEILSALANENKASASVFALLGDIHWRLGSLKDAIQCFTRASKLSPRSELASLGLFHTLWESLHTKRALNEMERFLSVSHSQEYARLLRELIPIPASSAARPAKRTRANHKAGTKRPARQAR